MGLLDILLGGSTKKVEEFKDKGALVIDVRTPGEFKSGHVRGAKNIPLQEIQRRKKEILQLNKPVIVCCASGARSGQANAMLKGMGVDSLNGGSWTKVDRVYGA